MTTFIYPYTKGKGLPHPITGRPIPMYRLDVVACWSDMATAEAAVFAWFEEQPKVTIPGQEAMWGPCALLKLDGADWLCIMETGTVVLLSSYVTPNAWHNSPSLWPSAPCSSVTSYSSFRSFLENSGSPASDYRFIHQYSETAAQSFVTRHSAILENFQNPMFRAPEVVIESSRTALSLLTRLLLRRVQEEHTEQLTYLSCRTTMDGLLAVPTPAIHRCIGFSDIPCLVFPYIDPPTNRIMLVVYSLVNQEVVLSCPDFERVWYMLGKLRDSNTEATCRMLLPLLLDALAQYPDNLELQEARNIVNNAIADQQETLTSM